MEIRVFLRGFGTLLKLLGLLMLIPAGVALFYKEYVGVTAFVVPAILTLIIGFILERVGIEKVLDNKEAFALVAFGWLGVAIIGSLPYVFLGMSSIDALFESMSGFTTTGATILVENNTILVGNNELEYWIINSTAASHSLGLALIETASRSQIVNSTLNLSILANITAVNTTASKDAFLNATLYAPVSETYFGLLFWRSFTQWLGGMGIILLFVAILPKLGVAGRQLFKAEVPGPTEDLIRPRIRETAKILWGVYIVLSAAEILLLILAKMPAYDAICNTFSTMSCGGFSPQAESIAAYNNPLIEVIVIVFMFLAGANFALHYRTMYGKRNSLISDPEFRFYASLVAVAIFIVLIFGGKIGENFSESLRTVAFQVVSIVTTTGFATANYDNWLSPAKLVLFMLMFTGACAGSTSGGIKLVRILLITKYSKREMFKALHPKVVMPIKLKGNPVGEEILHSILFFFALYILIFAAASVMFASVSVHSGSGEIDMVSATSAVAVNLGNVGPGFGDFGPVSNYSHIPAFNKLILIVCMWIGRLEILTVLVLFIPDFWKN
ncbi:MAG: TrkH family potassium uptake protein [Methanotrichaceae archaeon]